MVYKLCSVNNFELLSTAGFRAYFINMPVGLLGLAWAWILAHCRVSSRIQALSMPSGGIFFLLRKYGPLVPVVGINRD